MMISDINMLGLIMKNWILREFDKTLIIIVNHCQIDLLTNQTNQDLPHPNGLTCCLTCIHVLTAIDLCFLLYQETIADPILKIPPHVLKLLDGLPSQSTSVKP